MKTPNLILVLILSICLFGCDFEENQEVEKKLTKTVNNFHALFNQEKFNQIYWEADDELKNKYTEQQFVSYLEIVKENDVEELKEISQVWINDESKDRLKSIWFKKTRFSNIETIYAENNIYLEHFEWNLINGKAKLVSYEITKASDYHEVIFD